MRISERLSRHRIKPAPVQLDDLAHSNLTGLEDIGVLAQPDRPVIQPGDTDRRLVPPRHGARVTKPTVDTHTANL